MRSISNAIAVLVAMTPLIAAASEDKEAPGNSGDVEFVEFIGAITNAWFHVCM